MMAPQGNVALNVEASVLKVVQAAPTSWITSSALRLHLPLARDSSRRAVESNIALVASLGLVVELLVHLHMSQEMLSPMMLRNAARETRGLVTDPERFRRR